MGNDFPTNLFRKFFAVSCVVCKGLNVVNMSCELKSEQDSSYMHGWHHDFWGLVIMSEISCSTL